MKILSTVGLVLLFTACAFGQNVRLTWIGQSGFIVQSDGGPTVVADPPSPNIGYPIPDVNADAVTVTHNHGDHNYTAGVKGNFTVVDGRPVTSRSQMTVANLPFVMIPGFHDGQAGVATGPNTIIQWTQSGLRFAHFGDFGQDTFTDAQLADLQNIDIAFFPASGYFTVDP
ncbi:MAG TPA: MBL fold metallo-hydrolase, partial [Bryobacteraceae bacterium]|nr:MBL fold metallo-hydrolase [Bryobacteraceae bacterium]